MIKQQIKIIVADDHAFFRDGLVRVLELERRYQVIDEAKNGEELINKIKYHKPDLAIVDIEMPILNGFEAMHIIKELGINTEVIALSMHSEESVILKMLQAGAMGYLEKNISREEIYKAVESVVIDRRMYFPESTSKRMFQMMEKSSLRPFDDPTMIFSEKEIEIMKYVCMDFTNKEIGDKMEVSSRTIEGHRDKMMKKMRVRSVAGLVAYAFSNNLIKADDIINKDQME